MNYINRLLIPYEHSGSYKSFSKMLHMWRSSGYENTCVNFIRKSRSMLINRNTLCKFGVTGIELMI